MSEKNDRLYSRQHEWAIFKDDGTCVVGISDYAQKELGNIVFANLPEEGDEVTADTPFCDVESIKTVSDVYSPVSGKVISVNEEVIHGIPGSILGALVGAIVTERVYSVPGAGNLLTNAINAYDNGVIVGITLFYATLSVVGLLLGDILMAVADPRISFDTKER